MSNGVSVFLIQQQSHAVSSDHSFETFWAYSVIDVECFQRNLFGTFGRNQHYVKNTTEETETNTHLHRLYGHIHAQCCDTWSPSNHRASAPLAEHVGINDFKVQYATLRLKSPSRDWNSRTGRQAASSLAGSHLFSLMFCSFKYLCKKKDKKKQTNKQNKDPLSSHHLHVSPKNPKQTKPNRRTYPAIITHWLNCCNCLVLQMWLKKNKKNTHLNVSLSNPLKATFWNIFSSFSFRGKIKVQKMQISLSGQFISAHWGSFAASWKTSCLALPEKIPFHPLIPPNNSIPPLRRKTYESPTVYLC